LTIRGKLYTAIVVTVAGLAVTAGVGIWALTRLSDRFDVVQRAADDRALALELKFDVTDFNGWQTAYGYDGGRSRPLFLASVGRFRADLARAKERLRRPQETRLLAGVESAFTDFMRLDAVAWAALRADKTDQVRRLFLGPEIANFERAAAAAQRLAELEAARADAEDRRFTDSRRDALRYLIAASILAALLVAILLVTAVDLVRSAERTLEGPVAPDG
jgi:cytochrome oxidase assembly protein ShyY1